MKRQRMLPFKISAKRECGGEKEVLCVNRKRKKMGVLLLSQECLNTALCLQPPLMCVNECVELDLC